MTERMHKRVCGDCQLCCKLIPVEEMDKPAFQKCEFQKYHKGCTIYPDRPVGCASWSCGWLVNPADPNGPLLSLDRPDRSGYVIDPMLGSITVQDDEGKSYEEASVEIWVDGLQNIRKPIDDPKFCVWHQENIPMLTCTIRYAIGKGVVMVPPNRNNGKDWKSQELQIDLDRHGRFGRDQERVDAISNLLREAWRAKRSKKEL